MDGDKNLVRSYIKIWDSITNTVIQDLTKSSDLQLQNFTFVLAPHPILEHILLTGSSGGQIALWNIKTRSLIKKFTEYGMYSITNYIMNDPYDGKFSPDGSSFVISSSLGTISIFGNDGAFHKYEQTRVEQFLPEDGHTHDINKYEFYDEEPQICGVNLIPHEYQPPSALIGKFKNARKLTHEEYERTLVLRKAMC